MLRLMTVLSLDRCWNKMSVGYKTSLSKVAKKFIFELFESFYAVLRV